MTSRVTVAALCAVDTQVVVQVHEGPDDEHGTSTVMDNGETLDFVVYDDVEVYVYERVKS